MLRTKHSDEQLENTLPSLFIFSQIFTKHKQLLEYKDQVSVKMFKVGERGSN